MIVPWLGGVFIYSCRHFSVDPHSQFSSLQPFKPFACHRFERFARFKTRSPREIAEVAVISREIGISAKNCA